MMPITNANAPTPQNPYEQAPELAAERLRRRRGEQPQARSGAVACGQQAAADVAASRRSSDAGDEQDRGRRDGQQQHSGLGAGERPELLRPSEGRRPSQPAGARGVGDHPAAGRTPPPPRLRARCATRLLGGHLAGERADADEHRDHRRDASARYALPPAGSPPASRPDERGQPQDRGPEGDRRQRGGVHRAARDRSRRGPARRARRPPRPAARGPPRASRTRPRRSPAFRRPARR